MRSLVSERGKRLFKYFKALGSPVRFLIIYKMLDGKSYTKTEILNYVNTLSGVPKTTVDRHFRTLLKYDVIKTTGKSPNYGERGRKPLLYVLAVDSLIFYTSLFTYLLEGVIDKRLKLIEKSLDGIEAFFETINDAKLRFYLVGHKIDDETNTNLSKLLDSCITLISIVRETIRPKTLITDCEDALELLSKISINQMILEKIPSNKIRELLYVAHIESGLPLEKLGFLLGIKDQTKLKEYDDLWKEIEFSYNYDLATLLRLIINNSKCTDIESSYIVSLTNNLIKYLSSDVMNQDLIRLILVL